MSSAECCHAVHEENSASLCGVERRDVLDLVALQWQALVVRHDFWFLDILLRTKGFGEVGFGLGCGDDSVFLELCFVVFGASEMTRMIDNVPIMLTAYNC